MAEFGLNSDAFCCIGRSEVAVCRHPGVYDSRCPVCTEAPRFGHNANLVVEQDERTVSRANTDATSFDIRKHSRRMIQTFGRQKTSTPQSDEDRAALRNDAMNCFQISQQRVGEVLCIRFKTDVR